MVSREAYSTLALRMQGLYAIELEHIFGLFVKFTRQSIRIHN
jgi:hypothetical protein